MYYPTNCSNDLVLQVSHLHRYPHVQREWHHIEARSRTHETKREHVIRPIYITILYHNLPLFIDICLIMRYYLWIFHCFCMLDDSWRMDCQSMDSDGKRGVLMQFRENQKNTRKIWEIIFSQKNKEARMGGEEGPQEAHIP